MYKTKMYIKFYDNTPHFKETIQILKKRFNTTASSTAVRWAIRDYAVNQFEVDRLNEVIGHQKERIKHLEKTIELLLERGN